MVLSMSLFILFQILNFSCDVRQVKPTEAKPRWMAKRIKFNFGNDNNNNNHNMKGKRMLNERNPKRTIFLFFFLMRKDFHHFEMVWHDNIKREYLNWIGMLMCAYCNRCGPVQCRVNENDDSFWWVFFCSVVVFFFSVKILKLRPLWSSNCLDLAPFNTQFNIMIVFW